MSSWKPEAYHLSVTRTARYYLLGRPGPALREWWFVLHGYGQLAATFLEAFGPLVDEKRLFVAPEALSRFYLNGFSGQVGASWMTREDRAMEIADYVAYLDALYYHLKQISGPGVAALHVLGFSQGAATACRWLALGHVRARRLILWAGDVPEDLPAEAAYRLPTPELVFGTRDRLLDAVRRQQLVERLQRLGLAPSVHLFDGGHRLHLPLLQELLSGPLSALPS